MYSTCLFCHRDLGRNEFVEHFPVGRRRRRHFLMYSAPPFLLLAFHLGSLVAGGAATLGIFGIQGWQMLTEVERRREHPETAGPRIHSEAARSAGRLAGWANRAVEYRGDDAVEALRKILPVINGAGGSRKTTDDAVTQLEEAPAPERYFAQAAWKARETSNEPWSARRGETKLRTIAPAILLGLEMAAHEEIERRVLEGELSRLEDEWRNAEEIAAIADNMFVPDSITSWIEGRRRGTNLPTHNT